MKYWGPLHDTSPGWPLWPVLSPYALLHLGTRRVFHAISSMPWVMKNVKLRQPLNLFGFGWNLFRRVSSEKGTGATMWIKLSSTSPIHHTTVYMYIIQLSISVGEKMFCMKWRHVACIMDINIITWVGNGGHKYFTSRAYPDSITFPENCILYKLYDAIQLYK